ncbi:metallophosphoesterase [Novosphingobium terrae]|uniref:metallophosphoesterase n=1 Tax=Novosphingobium terrae TaxID=2726189 RepID=UPI00198100B3|nr:metallophosphoesterase [Novosphingobium terrae]
MTLFRTLLAATALACTSTMALAAPAASNSFTIAVIPDTQNYIDYTHQKEAGFAFDARAMFLEQMHYIATRLKSAGGDVAFVDSLGDTWQHQSLDIDPAHAARGFKRVPNHFMDAEFASNPNVRAIEMPTARQGFEMIAGKTPFSVVPGNHDYDAMWTDANHPPAEKFTDMSSVGLLHSGGLNNFRSVFGAETPFFKGQPWYIASHDGGADSAQIFEAGGYRFLHIGLQFDAPNASLEWAAQVIREHPGLPTIVSTHDYMDNNGDRLPNPMIDNHAVDDDDNTPQMVWDKLISQHDQIFMVLCGHEHGQAHRVDANRFGHPVYQILADYQDRRQTAIDAGAKLQPGMGIGDGWLRFLTFDMGGKAPQVHVQTYSTYYKQQSTQTADYAKWYKAQEKPRLSDADFHGQDDFTLELSDFRQRFAKR